MNNQVPNTNPSLSDEQIVRQKYPDAYAHSPMGRWWYIDISRNTPMLGTGPSQEEAWADARSKLPAAVSEVDGGTQTEKLYYIQDTRNYVGNSVMWWCPDGNGYTSDLDQAWKVPLAKAQSKHKQRKTDVPWPCDEIDNHSQRHFDMQNLRMVSEVPNESK